MSLSDVLHRYDYEGNVNKGCSDTLLHGDFKREHLFVKVSDDEDDGALLGVIDWSDAVVGDIAIDLAGLATSVGQTTMQRIAVKAGVSRRSANRGAKMAMCDAIIGLNDHVDGNDRDIPEDLLRAQFRRAFEGTELERALLLNTCGVLRKMAYVRISE